MRVCLCAHSICTCAFRKEGVWASVGLGKSGAHVAGMGVPASFTQTCSKPPLQMQPPLVDYLCKGSHSGHVTWRNLIQEVLCLENYIQMVGEVVPGRIFKIIPRRTLQNWPVNGPTLSLSRKSGARQLSLAPLLPGISSLTSIAGIRKPEPRMFNSKDTWHHRDAGIKRPPRC